MGGGCRAKSRRPGRFAVICESVCERGCSPGRIRRSPGRSRGCATSLVAIAGSRRSPRGAANTTRLSEYQDACQVSRASRGLRATRPRPRGSASCKPRRRVNPRGARPRTAALSRDAGAYSGRVTGIPACEPLSARRLVLLNAMVPLPGERAGDWWEHTGAVDARRAAARAGGYPPSRIHAPSLAGPTFRRPSSPGATTGSSHSPSNNALRVSVSPSQQGESLGSQVEAAGRDEGNRRKNAWCPAGNYAACSARRARRSRQRPRSFSVRARVAQCVGCSLPLWQECPIANAYSQEAR